MKRSLRWVAAVGGFWAAGFAQEAGKETPETMRPGWVLVVSVKGGGSISHEGATVAAKVDDRVATGARVATGKGGEVGLLCSNLASLLLRDDAELSVTEFVQDPFGRTIRVVDEVREPTRSRTTVALRRGELTAVVGKVRTTEGSEFRIVVPDGTVEPEAGAPAGNVRLVLRPVEGGAGQLEIEAAGGVWLLKRTGRPVLRVDDGKRATVMLGGP